MTKQKTLGTVKIISLILLVSMIFSMTGILSLTGGAADTNDVYITDIVADGAVFFENIRFGVKVAVKNGNEYEKSGHEVAIENIMGALVNDSQRLNVGTIASEEERVLEFSLVTTVVNSNYAGSYDIVLYKDGAESERHTRYVEVRKPLPASYSVLTEVMPVNVEAGSNNVRIGISFVNRGGTGTNVTITTDRKSVV